MFPFVFFVGVCRNCRVLLAKMESIEKPEAEISFSIQMLKEFCNFFEIDTSHVKVRRKKPYVVLFGAFGKDCSCQKEADSD